MSQSHVEVPFCELLQIRKLEVGVQKRKLQLAQHVLALLDSDPYVFRDAVQDELE